MALFLFVIIIAIVLGILGIVLKGLFYLLIIAIAIFLINLIIGSIRYGRHRGTRRHRYARSPAGEHGLPAGERPRRTAGDLRGRTSPRPVTGVRTSVTKKNRRGVVTAPGTMPLISQPRPEVRSGAPRTSAGHGSWCHHSRFSFQASVKRRARTGPSRR